MQTWVDDWGPLISLASTVLLLGVTAWYAVLTKKVADASRDAAVQARIAAQASLAAVSAAEAAIEVMFKLAPTRGSTVGDLATSLKEAAGSGEIGNDQPMTIGMLADYTRLATIGLVCEGSTVYVHGCRLETLSLPRTEDGSHVMSETIRVRAPMESVGPAPRRLHNGESMAFRAPERSVGERYAAMSCTVSYSFDGAEGRFERLVSWREDECTFDREAGGLHVLQHSAEIPG
jgi:hypothetical protein